MIDELNYKFQCIENQMDIRVESLVTSIHECRDQFKIKLDKYKTDLEKLRILFNQDYTKFKLTYLFII
jgi:hypothetical protein